jgi:tRNA(Ile)-lysidine synthase
VGPPAAVAATRAAVRRSWPDLAPDARVLVACSGGADSLALAAAVSFEAPRAGLRAGAVTVDHALQAGSAQRAAAVAGTLAELGLDPVEVVTVAVSGGGGPEAAARRARRAALDACALRLDAAAVLLGHTADDQAETVLLGLARGSGARSLGGMRPVAGLLRRPFLGLPRSVVRRACLDAGLRPWDDPHNADPAYTRARVRSRVLPLLERELGPGVAAALARTADLLRADADALDAAAAAEFARLCGADGGLDAVETASLPEAGRRRVLRAWLVAAGSPAGALTAAHVVAVDALVGSWTGQVGVDLPGGVRATRTAGRLRAVCG